MRANICSKCHLNGIWLVCRWWPNIECWLGSLVLFQGIRTSTAMKLYIVVIFQGWGVRTPCPPPPPPPLDQTMKVFKYYNHNKWGFVSAIFKFFNTAQGILLSYHKGRQQMLRSPCINVHSHGSLC